MYTTTLSSFPKSYLCEMSYHITDPTTELKSLQFSAGSTSKHPRPPLHDFTNSSCFGLRPKVDLFHNQLTLRIVKSLNFKASQYFQTELYESIADSRIFTVATLCHRTQPRANGRYMLRPFANPVACCCVLLRVVGSCCVRLHVALHVNNLSFICSSSSIDDFKKY